MKLIFLASVAFVLFFAVPVRAQHMGFSHPGGDFGRHEQSFSHHDRDFSHHDRDFDRDFFRRGFHHRSFVFFYDPYPYYYPYYPYGYTEQYTPNYNPGSLSIFDITNMTARGVPDDEIINEIRRTGSVFSLNAELIAYLKQNKVSDKVIDYMLSTANTTPSPGY